VRRKDDLLDIPLTPSQRALLGLDPSATPPVTPGAQYITPPRYQRSATPRTSTPGSRSSGYSNSPLSEKGILSFAQAQGGSPMASPLLQKAMGRNGNDRGKRQSYGSASPLASSITTGSSIIGTPSTPSPSSGKGASVGLNSRWLYERGRASPGSGRLFS